MTRRTSVLLAALMLGSACDAKEADTAPAVTKEAQTRLVGAWVQVEEFGGGDCKGLDCSAPLPEERQTKLEFSEGSYTMGEDPPMKGPWEVKSSEGDTLTIEMGIEGMAIPPSPKTVTFLAADRFEMKNDAGHGGIYQRPAG